jgi:hypothetical protein
MERSLNPRVSSYMASYNVLTWRALSITVPTVLGLEPRTQRLGLAVQQRNGVRVVQVAAYAAEPATTQHNCKNEGGGGGGR